MRVFSFDHYIFSMKFLTSFTITYRNLHGFARFPCDSTARVAVAAAASAAAAAVTCKSINAPFSTALAENTQQ